MGVSLPLDTGNHFLSIQICLLWTYKWIHTICGLSWLVSFLLHNVFKVDPCCSMSQRFVLFYGWIIFHCIEIPHLFIHSSIDGHLCCFHFLIFMNSAPMNMDAQISLWGPILNSLHIYPEVGMLIYGSSIFNFLGNLHTIFHST